MEAAPSSNSRFVHFINSIFRRVMVTEVAL